MKPFKIWCETEREKKAVLKEMERQGVKWSTGRKPTELMNGFPYRAPIGLLFNCYLSYTLYKDSFIQNPLLQKSVREFLNEQEKIIIYRDGQKVIALDKRTGEKAEARCNPSDTFDFNIGARIAFDRLIPDKKAATPEPRGFTGKAVYIGVIPAHDQCFTIGKIYKFADGKVKDNDGDLRPCYGDISQKFGVTHDLNNWHFLPIVE